jgi:hypothetical protein
MGAGEEAANNAANGSIGAAAAEQIAVAE